jgi:MFS family permease
VQLALTRSGVAAGEAAATPAAHALISNHYSDKRRGTMIAIYSVGSSLGAMAGLIGGGRLADIYGWRVAMTMMGIPGIVLAILIALTIKNVTPTKTDVKTDSSATFAGTLGYLVRKTSYRHIFAAMVTSSVCSMAFAAFNPVFLMRIHHLSMTRAGATMGLIGGIVTSLGMLTGGVIADRIGYHRPRWALWFPGLAHLVAAPFVLATYFVPSLWMAIVGLIVPAFSASTLVMGYTAAQRLALPHMRATTTAVLALGSILIGGSLGPLIVGMVSDTLKPTLGVDALRYGLGVTSIFYVWSAVHFCLAGKPFERDLGVPNATDA